MVSIKIVSYYGNGNHKLIGNGNYNANRNYNENDFKVVIVGIYDIK